MQHIEKSIDVEAPVRKAYNQWTQFETFPRFMMQVRSVKQLDAAHLLWEAEIGGKVVEWTAEITQQEPDSIVAWRSTSGIPNAGSVRFDALTPARTRITLSMDYEPEGTLEAMASASGLVARRVEHDLEKFKDLIEEPGRETGAWRGTIRNGKVADGGTS